MEVILGGMADPIGAQFPHLPEGTANMLQGHADAITRLSAFGILTGREVEKARNRLAQKIFAMVRDAEAAD